MAFDICNEAKDKKEILHDGNKLSEPGTILYQEISWQKSKITLFQQFAIRQWNYYILGAKFGISLNSYVPVNCWHKRGRHQQYQSWQVLGQLLYN